MSSKSLPVVNKILEFINLIKNIRSIITRVFFGSRKAKSFRHWRDYFTIQPIAGYVGWLGYDNFGDEALHTAFEDLFPEFQILTYNDYNNPIYNTQRNIYPIELILYRNLIKRERFYNFVFLGGGTLINHQEFLEYLQCALHNGKQIIIFGAGVSDPSFRVKHNPDVDYSQLMADWISVLHKAAYVGVRGPKSANILEENGFSTAKVIGDPALSLCRPKSQNYSRTGIIAINLCNHGLIWGNQEQVNETIARLVQHLLEKGWDVEFIPMQLKDLQLGLKIIHDFNLHKVSIWREYRNIGKTINRIQTYDILVGQRLHSVVFACGCGIPSVMLEYQPKSRDFMESIGMQQFSIRTDVIDLDKVLSLIYDIEMNYVDYCKQLISTCNHYRLLQRQAAQEVVNLLKWELAG
jgi:polysaccharide pyruvyl transferase WcaK-like protein